MGLGGVPQLIRQLHTGVDGCVKADGVFSAGNVVVNGAGKPYDMDARFGKL
ncbi:hypothetical protein SDC9_69637 [bioreactor metagenome]|uniref:Uncharacterized protein n=1 Tax=bioreactor metagenome TaxID=1076179 RepID=A0A644Y9C4_9ZZZZ